MREKELHDAARQAMQEARSVLLDLDERSRTIFRELVESYLANGEPVGSRNISRQLPITLSPASVRNVMADLEAAGLIFAPHTSAGRMPTETGLRLFVDGLLQVGDLSDDERSQIKSRITGGVEDMGIEDMLGEAGDMLSGLAGCAGVVLADKESRRLRQIEFVALDKARALAVLVGEDGSVENRVVNLPDG
ncbi:MAG: HrcA family transcriptional regulator, partial [Methyloligellaceae bacterium]